MSIAVSLVVTIAVLVVVAAVFVTLVRIADKP